MKKILTIISVLLLLFSSCSKKNTAAETVQKSDTVISEKNIFETDSLMLSDSIKLNENLTAAFKIKTLVFPNITNKSVLDSIYSVQSLKAENYSKAGLKSAIDTLKNRYYTDTKEGLKDWSPEFEQTWEQNSAMHLFSKSKDFMTIQYTSDGYSGGAHGYYNELYKVFDMKSNQTVQLSDIIKNQDATIWGRILMTQFLQNDLEKGQAEMLLVKDILLSNNFYFDAANLYFLYNQYEIAAYAAGPVLIKVPFTEIKPLLTTSFRTRVNLK